MHPINKLATEAPTPLPTCAARASSRHMQDAVLAARSGKHHAVCGQHAGLRMIASSKPPPPIHLRAMIIQRLQCHVSLLTRCWGRLYFSRWVREIAGYHQSTADRHALHILQMSNISSKVASVGCCSEIILCETDFQIGSVDFAFTAISAISECERHH